MGNALRLMQLDEHREESIVERKMRSLRKAKTYFHLHNKEEGPGLFFNTI